jgi:hypothetical protein
VGIRAKSAVLPNQYNIILNPGFPDFHKIVRVAKVEPLEVDQRLKGTK